MHLLQSIDSWQLDEDIFGSAEALLPALLYVPSVAATDSSILITGEVGTGIRSVAPRKLRRRLSACGWIKGNRTYWSD